MTKFFHLLANKLFPVRYVFIALSLLCASAIGYFLLFSTITLQQRYLLPSLLLLLWSLLLYLMIASFSSPATSLTAPGFLQRIKQRLIQFIGFVYLIVFVILLIMTVYFTFKISNI